MSRKKLTLIIYYDILKKVLNKMKYCAIVELRILNGVDI